MTVMKPHFAGGMTRVTLSVGVEGMGMVAEASGAGRERERRAALKREVREQRENLPRCAQ